MIDYQYFNKKTLISDDNNTLDTRMDESMEAVEFSTQLLEEAEMYWNNLHPIRQRRERNRRFVIEGDQWSDEMEDPDNPGEYITTGEYVKRLGATPTVNNQLAQLVRNLIGQFRNNENKPVVKARVKEQVAVSEMLTNALHYCHDVNQTKELDANIFLDFTLSGMPLWKTGYRWNSRRNQDDVFVDKVNVSRVFFNTNVSDPRMHDLNFIGELIDTSIDSLIATYAKTEEEKETLRRWYSKTNVRERRDHQLFGSQREDGLEFYYPFEGSDCRVIEIWKKSLKRKVICHDILTGEYYQSPHEAEEAVQEVEMQNAERMAQAMAQGVSPDDVPIIEYEVKDEMVWCYYILTPQGHVLASGETPYEHEEHPYVILPYPMIDSEIRAFVDDLIPQALHINKMITLIDLMIAASAKGVLFVPEETIPKGYDLSEIADEYRRVNGVVKIKLKPGQSPPFNISGNSNIGSARDLLAIQTNAIKEISGITDAIQGQAPNSGTPAALYAQQTQNASLSTKNMFMHFDAAIKERDYKVVRLIQQYYDEPRYIDISGADYGEEAMYYDPNVAADVPVDMVITSSGNSPVYRQMMDDYLFNFLQAGHITLEQFLENTSAPFASKLLQQIKLEKNEMMQQMQMQQAQQAQQIN